jgi:hypothetical protein
MRLLRPVGSLVWLLVVIAVLQPRKSQAQSNSLHITSAADGTVIYPGQTISVTITSDDPNVVGVALIGEDPFGIIGPLQTHLPAVFTVTVPKVIRFKSYSLTAMASTTTPGRTVQSDPLTIDVERPELPLSLSSSLRSVEVTELSDGMPLSLKAKFRDGKSMDVSDSSPVTYTSSNPGSFTISADGELLPGAPGRGIATATYTLNGTEVSLHIPITISRAALSPSVHRLSFGQSGVGSLSTPQRLTLTNTTNSPIEATQVNVTPYFHETNTCTSSPIPPHGTCTIEVRFTPVAEGEAQGTLTIVSNSDGTRVLVPIKGIGH